MRGLIQFKLPVSSHALRHQPVEPHQGRTLPIAGSTYPARVPNVLPSRTALSAVTARLPASTTRTRLLGTPPPPQLPPQRVGRCTPLIQYIAQNLARTRSEDRRNARPGDVGKSTRPGIPRTILEFHTIQILDATTAHQYHQGQNDQRLSD